MSDMICTCNIEGAREVEDRRLRIYHRMKLDHTKDLAMAIVLSLAFDFEVDDYSIAADHWFGVSVHTPLLPDWISIECDWPFDGLAALWEQLATEFPDRVSTKLNTSARLVHLEGMLLNALFKHYEELEKRYESHKENEHKGEYMTDCDDCWIGLALVQLAREALDSSWGAQTLEPAIKEAFGE